MKGELEFKVGQPPAQVFAYVADLERAPEWVPDLVSIEKVSDGEVGVGTRYQEVVKLGKHTSTAELEITEYEPPRVFAHRGEGGPSRFTGRFVLEPDGAGTRVRHEYDVRLTGAARLMAPLIHGWVKSNARAGVENLERVLGR